MGRLGAEWGGLGARMGRLRGQNGLGPTAGAARVYPEVTWFQSKDGCSVLLFQQPTHSSSDHSLVFGDI